jgi:predicted nucleotidyltransferase
MTGAMRSGSPPAHGIPQAALGRIRATLARFPEVRQATLYGSRALGRHRPGSDIDLSLEGPDLDGCSLARIDAALDDLLLPWRFDLCLRGRLRQPELLEHIERVGQVLYRAGGSPP